MLQRRVGIAADPFFFYPLRIFDPQVSKNK